MALPETLTLEPVPHPSPRIHRIGFPLDHPYVEHCWAPSIGPTSTMLLRRAVWLWDQATPAVVRSAELGGMLGLGPGTGNDSTFARAVRRLDRFGLAAWDSESGHLAVYTEVPPQLDRHLRRFPPATRRLHDELLGEHLDALARNASAPSREAAVRVAGRLDRLERPTPGLERSLGR